MRKAALLFLTCSALTAAPELGAQLDVTTWRYDATRQGQNTQETQLTPANVNAASFGKLRSYAVDGSVYAQPLYTAGLPIAGGTHNVVYVATQHDSIYAFDADQNQTLWQASLVDQAHGASAGATTVPSGDVGTSDIVPEIGITGTPVIDPAAETIYVVAKSKENGSYVLRLHALDITTGAERPNSPVAIVGAVPGNGNGSSGGLVSFVPKLALQRAGLLLLNGRVYFAAASHGDNGPYHGWVFAYDAVTLQQTGIYCTSPSGSENGVWMSGAGLAADTNNGSGRLFIANGNGSFDAAVPYSTAQSFGDGVDVLDLSGGGLLVADAWVPFDQDYLSRTDLDEGSGGVLILPDQPGAHPHELIQVGKIGRIEVLDRDNLGGYTAGTNNIAQEVAGQTGGLWSTPAYWNGNVYLWGNGDTLKQFSLTNGRLSAAPIYRGPETSPFPGASPVISSNGATNGVLWAVRSDGYNGNNAALLEAYDATNVSRQLYTSFQAGSRDVPGAAVKFVVPLVVNGQVYVGTQHEVDVYGLLARSTPVTPLPSFSPAPGNYNAEQVVTISDTLPGAAIHYTIDGSTPTANSPLYTTPIHIDNSVLLQAVAVSAGAAQSGAAVGMYTIAGAPTINFPVGFSSVAGLQLNGSAVHSDDSRLQLTTGGTYQAGSFWYATPVSIQRFTTDYTFQLSGPAPLADGITFTIQGVGASALGGYGGGLGYGSDHFGGPAGIQKSIALKFDLYNNAGEGTNSTGLYLNGAPPIGASNDLTPFGIVLASGDIMAVHETYDGSTLTITLRDTLTGKSVTGSVTGDLTQVVGGPTAYVGFTGGTGGLTASQKILSWTFNGMP